MFTEKSTAVQLRGPSSKNGTGRVEVYYNGTWGTICEYDWDINDAKVACRELGFQHTISHRRSGSVPYSWGPTWLYDVDCAGNEQRLSDCRHAGWGNSSYYCPSFLEAAVDCSSTGNI